MTWGVLLFLPKKLLVTIDNIRNKVTYVTGRVLLQERFVNAKGNEEWKARMGWSKETVAICVSFLGEDGLEFFWESMKGRKAKLIGTQVATGYGIGGVVCGCYVFEDGGNERRCQDRVGAADGEVDVEVGTSAFAHRTDGALVI